MCGSHSDPHIGLNPISTDIDSHIGAGLRVDPAISRCFCSQLSFWGVSSYDIEDTARLLA